MPRLSPVAAYAEQLAAEGVPLSSIINMIEAHYADALAQVEATTREALTSTLHVEALRDKLAAQADVIGQLRSTVNLAVTRATALQTTAAPTMSTAGAARVPVRQPAVVVHSPEQLHELAEEQYGLQQTPGPPKAARQPNAQSQQLIATLQHDQLQRQLDHAQAEAKRLSTAFDKTNARRKTLESDNHTLNMSVLGLHDEISKLREALEATQERLRNKTLQSDTDRQALVQALSDAKSELASTKHHAATEIASLNANVAEMGAKLEAAHRAYMEMKEDYLAVARRQAEADDLHAGSTVLTSPGKRKSQSQAPPRSPSPDVNESSSADRPTSPTLSEGSVLLALAAERSTRSLVPATTDTWTSLHAALADAVERADQAEATLACAKAEGRLVPRFGAGVVANASPPHALKAIEAPTSVAAAAVAASTASDVSRAADGAKALTPPPAPTRRLPPADGSYWGSSAAKRSAAKMPRAKARHAVDSTATGWGAASDRNAIARLTRAPPPSVLDLALPEGVGGVSLRRPPRQLAPLSP